MFQDTSRKTVSLVLPIVGMSLAVALYGAPPWPVLPLLGGISLFWWGSNRSGDSKGPSRFYAALHTYGGKSA